jgi:hypothetical protein
MDDSFAFSSAGLPESVKLRSGGTLRRRDTTPYRVGYDNHRGLVVIASWDTEAHGRLLHVSASHRDHEPTWPEILDIHHGFAPNLAMMMLLPRAENYVNNHPYALNFYGIPVDWLPRLGSIPLGVGVAGDLGQGLFVRRDGETLAISERKRKPRWETICSYRDAYTDPKRDVMVWWDRLTAPRANLTVIHLAYTPEPWQGGFAVGVAGVAPAVVAALADAERQRGKVQRP